ncbi:lysine-specific demethylase JMJ25 [Carex littledalei]|uniref:Lysine-specific demethylase JMJ25 n=1 Tax=Carex littledalei TaxID=544730 RepID=A0A833QFN7_9POAL|nr:lysine-specific demethylase JMJ25 [Carex littledalei]
MDQLRLSVGPPEETNSVPEELRCKRSDGKQWRCSALSMPDKTVCEKHYIQAKKRAANSALRASLKKARRMAQEEEEVGARINGFAGAGLNLGSISSARRFGEKFNRMGPIASGVIVNRENKETVSKLVFLRNGIGANNNISNGDGREFGENGIGPGPVPEDNSLKVCGVPDRPTELICHQCQENARGLLCTSCNKKSYCANCISKWYPEIPLDEIKKVCPACRGICNCQICLQGDNLIKAKVQEMGGIEKLKYLHRLLVYVLPVVKHIYASQCFEIGVEAKMQGSKVDIPRAKIDPDQQILCDFCKVPIFDYHRHCTDCSYDLCLACSRDIRDASKTIHEPKETCANSICFSELFPSWKASRSGTIPCGPHTLGGCGRSELILRRILKINWISKLAKNTEEMVYGCQVLEQMDPSCGTGEPVSSPYCALWDEVKQEGVSRFSKYWERGVPVVVRHSFEMPLASSWDPLTIWRGVKETIDEEMDDSLVVKAMDCKSQSEVEIELAEFLRGYSERNMLQRGELTRQILRLTGWPSATILEEFLVCQRPEFLVNFPLIDFIHSKWGVINLPSKLPHDSSMPEMGPGLSVSYGNSVTNLQVNMCDVVFMLMHTTGLHQQKETSTSNNHEFEGSKSINGSKIDSFSIELERENLVGAVWDVLRREDVPKLNEFLRVHWQEIGPTHQSREAEQLVYDGAIFLDEEMKVLLKNEYGIQPWSIIQQIGDAVFIPAGCAFQVRNIQSSVQLKLEFLLPESVQEAARMAQEIRCLPNDHHAKLNMLEVEKICLYAASSAIREIQKISLDPNLNLDKKFKDRNLTQAVSENLARVSSNKLQVVVNS